MISKRNMRNAERIKELSEQFGHCTYSASDLTIDQTLNLSIPCAVLICAGIVTSVIDSFDAVNDQAVADMVRYCHRAIDYHRNTTPWIVEAGKRLNLI